MPATGFVSALLLGLLGGVHCAGMCGGFVAAASGTQRVHVGRASLLLHILPYHAGRITSYALAGALFGAFGAVIGRASAWLSLQQTLFTLGNVFLIVIGLALVLRASGWSAFERTGATLFRLIAPFTRRLTQTQAWPQRYLLGMVWGSAPCGLVYTMLALALLTGNAWSGAGLALTFGLGTLPNLLAAGWVLQRARRWAARNWMRTAAGVALAGFGVLGVLHVDGYGSQLVSSLFCAVPH